MYYYILRCLPIYYYVPLYCKGLSLDFTWFKLHVCPRCFIMVYEVSRQYTTSMRFHKALRCLTRSHDAYHAARVFATFYNIPRGCTMFHIDSQCFTVFLLGSARFHGASLGFMMLYKPQP